MRAAKIFLSLGVLLASGRAHAFTLTLESTQRGWDAIPVRFRVNPSSCSGIAEDKLMAAVDKALEAWSSVPTSRLKLERGENTADDYADVQANVSARYVGDPVIFCDSSYQSNFGGGSAGRGGAVPYAGDYVLKYGFLVLNTQAGSTGSLLNVSDNVLTHVIAHEIGHVVGLGHSEDPMAIMSYSHEQDVELVLGQDDVDGISYLYPRREGAGDQLFGCGTISGDENQGGGGLPPNAVHFAGILLFCALVTRAMKRGARNPDGFGEPLAGISLE